MISKQVTIPIKKFDELFDTLYKRVDECNLSEFLHERISQAIARCKRDLEES